MQPSPLKISKHIRAGGKIQEYTGMSPSHIYQMPSYPIYLVADENGDLLVDMFKH